MTTLALLSIVFFFALLHFMKKTDEGKNTWLFGLITFPLLILSFIYVEHTWVDTVFLDGFIHVPLVGRFMSGNLAMSEFFQPAGEHILLGYKALFLLNARYLDLDMRLDPVMFVLSFLLLSSLIYLECSKILKNEKLWLLGIFFIPLALISFSLTAPPLMFMSTQFTWGASIALLTAWFLQNEFDRSSITPRVAWPLVGTLVSLVVYYLVFSGSYFPGMIFGIAGMIILRLIVEKRQPDWRIGSVILVGAICSFWYVYIVFFVQVWGGEASLTHRLDHFATAPADTILTYFAGIGASLVDQHSLENKISVLLYLGGAMVLIAGFAIWLYLKTRMYRLTYLPIFCLSYSLGIISAVRLGRNQQGDWGWIANNWYSFHLRLFCLGVVWILLFAIISHLRSRSVKTKDSRVPTRWQASIAMASLAFIFSCHAFANYCQLHRGPSVRGWVDAKRAALLFPEFTDQSLLLWGPTEVASARSILQKYRLSSFSVHSLNETFSGNPDGLIRYNGWYADNWLGESASVVFWADNSDDVKVTGQLPPFIAAAKIDVLLNESHLFSGELAAGQTKSFVGKARSGMNVLTIRTDRSVVPAAVGIGADIRPLSFFVQEARFPSR